MTTKGGSEEERRQPLWAERALGEGREAKKMPSIGWRGASTRTLPGKVRVFNNVNHVIWQSGDQSVGHAAYVCCARRYKVLYIQTGDMD